MGLLDSVFGKSKVNAANKKVKAAREANDPIALEKALAGAITIYQSVGSDSSVFKDALYNWGMALLYSARLKKQGAEAMALYEEAGKKFSFCLVAKPDYLAAALDWSVALMELAALQSGAAQTASYALAKEKLQLADSIQKGVASYNFACLHAVEGDFHACKVALELARDYKNLPDEQDILNDADMQVAKTQDWFDAFIASINAPVVEEVNAEGESTEAKKTGTVYSKTQIKTDGVKVKYDEK
ncbi:MAG: hypothetical protein RQ733_09400 [Methyloprofundus sp.]|nr:hypothetical protein [Methyloprofundus sp.]MDT8426176.1 hypothetical protein [Methyloprofundus sp.]